MKKIVLTGGGTAGHVTPNIALLPALQAAGYEIAYVGSYEGIEKKLIADRFRYALLHSICHELLFYDIFFCIQKQENIIYPIGFNRNNCCMCMAWRTYAAVSCI